LIRERLSREFRGADVPDVLLEAGNAKRGKGIVLSAVRAVA